MSSHNITLILRVEFIRYKNSLSMRDKLDNFIIIFPSFPSDSSGGYINIKKKKFIKIQGRLHFIFTSIENFFTLLFKYYRHEIITVRKSFRCLLLYFTTIFLVLPPTNRNRCDHEGCLYVCVCGIEDKMIYHTCRAEASSRSMTYPHGIIARYCQIGQEKSDNNLIQFCNVYYTPTSFFFFFQIDFIQQH